MSRFTVYGRRDSPWVPDGDAAFYGLNMLVDRSALTPGILARSENKRLRDGAAATRPGTTFPGDFNPAFENRIIGSQIFSNPNGDEVMLSAPASVNHIWACQFGKDPVQIQIDATDPTQDTGAGFVHFIQAFEKVIAMRFPFSSQPPLVWDGDNTHKFVPIALSANGKALIPATVTGIPFQNRLLLYSPYAGPVPDRNQIIMTDVLDYTSYDPFLQVFRISAGESDTITSVFPYFRGSVLVFMRNSVHMLENFTLNPFSAIQRLLNSRVGSVGYQGPLQVGTDVIFLSRRDGFYRVSEIIQDQINAQPVPLSRKIQPVIDRINWDYANLYFSSAAVGDYAYFAVPLDAGVGAANAVLVYNTVTNEWESVDNWDDDSFRINRLHVTNYDGQPRVFGFDYAASRCYLLYDGVEDEINGTAIPVNDVIETRGYMCGDPASFKRFQRLNIGIRTYDPEAVVTAVSDGVNEEKQLATITKDRLRFYTHAYAPYDPATGDPNEPKREDYSLQNDESSAIEDFEGLPDGPLPVLPATSITFTGVKQQSLERFQIRFNGRWCSVRIENTNGQLDVLGVGVEAIPAEEGIRAVA